MATTGTFYGLQLSASRKTLLAAAAAVQQDMPWELQEKLRASPHVAVLLEAQLQLGRLDGLAEAWEGAIEEGDGEEDEEVGALVGGGRRVPPGRANAGQRDAGQPRRARADDERARRELQHEGGWRRKFVGSGATQRGGRADTRCRYPHGLFARVQTIAVNRSS